MKQHKHIEWQSRDEANKSVERRKAEHFNYTISPTKVLLSYINLIVLQ